MDSIGIDLNKKFQDLTNDIVTEAQLRSHKIDPNFESFLKGLVAVSLKKGFIYGLQSISLTANTMIKQSKE